MLAGGSAAAHSPHLCGALPQPAVPHAAPQRCFCHRRPSPCPPPQARGSRGHTSQRPPCSDPSSPPLPSTIGHCLAAAAATAAAGSSRRRAATQARALTLPHCKVQNRKPGHPGCMRWPKRTEKRGGRLADEEDEKIPGYSSMLWGEQNCLGQSSSRPTAATNTGWSAAFDNKQRSRQTWQVRRGKYAGDCWQGVCHQAPACGSVSGDEDCVK